MQIGGWWILTEHISPYPLVQNLCDASIFLHARPNFRKNEKGPKFNLYLGSFPPKI